MSLSAEFHGSDDIFRQDNADKNGILSGPHETLLEWSISCDYDADEEGWIPGPGGDGEACERVD